MSAVERLAILVTADGQGAIREFGKVGDAAERDLGKAESRVDRLGARMTSAGAVMMGASAVMVAGLWQAGQAAAAQEQAVGGAEAVFKEHAAGMEEWARGAAQSAGLSEEAALRLATRMGGALKGLGFTVDEAATKSKELTQVAADLAATYGGTTEDAVQALGAAFRGEFDPAEQFNVFLKQSTVNAKAVEMGLAKSTTEVDAHARAQATLALITEQSSDAQGQFSRETDTTSGRLAIASAEFENLKAQVGAGFTPVMTAAGSVLGGVTGALRSADDATGGLASQLVGIGSVGVGAVGALTFVGGQAIQARDKLKDLAENGSEFLQGLTGRLSGTSEGAGRLGSALNSVGSVALPVVGAAAIAGVAVWQMWSAEQEAARKRTEEFRSTLDEATGAITENTSAKVLSTLQDKNRLDDLDRAGVSVKDYTDALADNSSAMVDRRQVVDALIAAEGGMPQVQDQVIAKLREQGGARNELVAKLLEQGDVDKGLIDQIYEESGAYDDAQAALREKTIQQGIAAGKTREAAEADIDAKLAAEAHTQAMKDQNDAQRALLDPLFGAVDALESNRDALQAAEGATTAAFYAQVALNQAVKEHGPNSKEALEAQDALNQALEKADDANLSAAKSALDVDQSLRTLSGAVADGTVKFSDAQVTLQNWVNQGLITQEQANQVAGKLQEVSNKAAAIPRDIFTTARADVSGAIREFNNLLDVLRNVPQGATITMNGRISEVRTPGISAGVPSSLAGRAAGGDVSPWSVYQMHDTSDPEILRLNNGKSLVFTGAQGGRVTNLGTSGAGSGGGGGPVILQLYTAPGTPASQIDEMLRLLRQNQGEVQRALGLS